MSTRLMSAVGANSTLHNASRAMLRRGLLVPRTAREALSSRAPRPLPPTASLLRGARPMLQHQSAKGEKWGGVPTGIAVAAAVMAAAALVSSRREDGHVPEVLAAEAYSLPIGRTSPQVCNCFIEVSRESRMKYEWDEETNMLKLDRVLHGAAFYPHDYGFIPQTLCGDGDPLDVLVLGTSALQPGSIVDVRPLGFMCMEDEKGLDEKVLAVPDKDPRFNHMTSLRDVPEHVLREITNFFETYKQLEKSKWVKVGGWKGTTDTHELIDKTHQKFLEEKKRIKGKQHGTAAVASATAGAGAAERRVKHAMD
ncbi:Inorganic diphosphatase [Ectocarpus siliculosus]|uniref:Inorganic pyrophosphatase n=1 Tax=Ectocarpus siliculosus TaxID=2880 RepID=D7G7D1_ECTSI|nr:Inorganic diphosphatase [Ectocarpus siliculosus]|eukprot:CBJ27682.1 Inorganic diphosphatase [Ectocarpus siliculosus]